MDWTSTSTLELLLHISVMTVTEHDSKAQSPKLCKQQTQPLQDSRCWDTFTYLQQFNNVSYSKWLFYGRISPGIQTKDANIFGVSNYIRCQRIGKASLLLHFSVNMQLTLQMQQQAFQLSRLQCRSVRRNAITGARTRQTSSERDRPLCRQRHLSNMVQVTESNPNLNRKPNPNPNRNPKSNKNVYDTGIKFNIINVISLGTGWVYKRPITETGSLNTLDVPVRQTSLLLLAKNWLPRTQM